VTLWAALGAFAVALFLSAAGTAVTRRLAWRFGMVDLPARHKAHPRPTPLLGGCAILAAVLLPSLLVLALVRFWAAGEVPARLPAPLAVHVHGAAAMAPTALIILAGAVALHVVGLIDDRRHLGAWPKLIAQLAVCGAVVLACPRVRVLTVAGRPVSAILSILWLVVITNAFNFLDNMDGLSAGVGAICAAGLLGVAAGIGTVQVFVAGWLCLLLGGLLGFLPYNLAPARSFMGDAGSLVVGYFLGVLSAMTTYAVPGEPYYLYGVFVPLVLLAVPLYDTVSVVALRLRDRRNPMVGDRRHFSHRLVRRGMGVRKAVLTIYLCTAATAAGAALLPRVDDVGAVLIFAQTLIVLLVVALLESGEGRP
jgi:UDP-GlcNAc:undecaprenyl-phosphate GlcNAc-1-phosphate transferase